MRITPEKRIEKETAVRSLFLQAVDKPHFTPEQPKAFPLRGRWREAPDEVEHVANSPEVPLKCSIFPRTSSVGRKADSFPSRGSLGC